MIELVHEEKKRRVLAASIKVVGVGGAGGNTIDKMSQYDCDGIELIAVNTDAQALELSLADSIIHIGQKSTKGLGAGANPDIGKRAAEEDLDKIIEIVGDADIVFLTGGMGGGTGSGALPVIVQALKERNILTIVVITKPFSFEGKRRALIAEQAIERIRQYADTVIIIPNQKLLNLVDDKVSMIDGFAMINEILNQSVRGISDIITKAGHINVDFADVREVMKNQGLAVMGTGTASGEGRAMKASLAAISSPLLENVSIAGARGVLINIAGSSSLGLHEIGAAASVIYDQVDENANIILGSVIDDSLGDQMMVTVIATGFNPVEQMAMQVKKEIMPSVECAQMPIEQPYIVPHVVQEPVVQLKTVEPAVQAVEIPVERVVEQETSLIQFYQTTTVKNEPVESIRYENFDHQGLDHASNVASQGPSYAHHQQVAAQLSSINKNDYDVPAFMRRDKNNDVEQQDKFKNRRERRAALRSQYQEAKN